MNKSQIIALYDQDQRKDVEYPDMRREVTPNVVRHINNSDSGEGVIIYSQLKDTNAEAPSFDGAFSFPNVPLQF